MLESESWSTESKQQGSKEPTACSSCKIKMPCTCVVSEGGRSKPSGGHVLDYFIFMTFYANTCLHRSIYVEQNILSLFHMKIYHHFKKKKIQKNQNQNTLHKLNSVLTTQDKSSQVLWPVRGSLINKHFSNWLCSVTKI